MNKLHYMMNNEETNGIFIYLTDAYDVYIDNE